jgi:hypothetical protein
MSKYILSNNFEVLGCFDDLNDISSYMLDQMINYLMLLVEIQNLNGKNKLPEHIFKIDSIKNNIIKDNIISFNVLQDNISILKSLNNSKNKINKINSLQDTLLTSKVYEDLFNNNENKFYTNMKLDNNSVYTSDVDDNTLYDFDDSSESTVNIIDTNMGDNVLEIQKMNDTIMEDNVLEIQKMKINDLLRKKTILENIKKKKIEKEEEIARRFQVDLNIYLKLKDKYTKETVPDIFKNKYIVFKEMEIAKIISNNEEAREYYTLNFNRINKNIGSKMFENIFSQIEPEEKIEQLSDSDESLNDIIRSDEIEYN